LLQKSDVQATAKVLTDKLRSFANFPYQINLKQNVHGPAVQTDTTWTAVETPSRYCRHNDFLAARAVGRYVWHYDYVLCMRCQCWPPQAADWPKRIRNHDVPDHTSINMIVSNGCDIVGAVHPRCRQDEWMDRHQWRLSFSRAEVTLLNSWTPVQQIIYHMLRFVLKREILSKTSDSDLDLPQLSNYHIKTLMLWECEQKPHSWWSAESSLIKLCSSLLHKLSDWVENNHCQHYFISNCNLLDHFRDVSLTISYDLRCLADSSFLLHWFVDNYIRECAQLGPRKVSELFENARSNDALERAIHAVVNWRLNIVTTKSLDKCRTSEGVILCVLQLANKCILLKHLRMKELLNFDPRLYDYTAAVTSLLVAHTISIHFLTEELLELLWAIFDPINAAESDGIESGERAYMCIRRAIKLVTLSTVRGDALEMLHNEMSKAYLHHSFQYGQKSTYCVVHVLLAVLYCKSEHYQVAIDHCKEVLNHCDSGHGSRYIGTQYLPPQVDESVDAVFGLILLYQHISNKMLQPQRGQSCRTLDPKHASHVTPAMHTRGRRQAVAHGQELFSSSPKAAAEPDSLPAFTTHLLARYLYSKCSTVVTSTVKLYRRHLWQTKQPLLSDILLFRLVEMQLCTDSEFTGGRTRNAGSNASGAMDTTLLVTMLELVALENLITAREVIVRELHCEGFKFLS